MIRIGITGLGDTIGIAKMHIKAFNLLDDAKITALYDILPGRAQGYKDELDLEDGKVCGSYEELLENVDAVIICTPNFTHTDLAIRALKAGKHVLCEKPLGTNEDNLLEALKYAKTAGTVSMTGLCYRYIPGMIYMKKLIDEGKLGDIYYIRQSQGGNRIANPDVKLEWRMQMDLSGPGAIADFGSHMLDMGDFLIGDNAGKITEVSCMEHTFIKERQVIGKDYKDLVTNGDVAVFNGRTEKGALLSYTASRIGASHTVEIYGSGGYLGFTGDNPFVITVLKKDINGAYEQEKQIVEAPKELYMLDDKTPEVPFLINMYLQGREFIKAIETGSKVPADFERGIYIQKIIDALQESAESNSTVKIDFRR